MFSYSWYFAGNTFMHRANPAVKMVLLVSAWILAFIFQHPLYNGLLLAIIISLVIILRIPWHLTKGILVILIPIVVVFTSLWPFFFPGGEVIASLPIFETGWVVNVTYEGLLWGFIAASRLAIMILSTFVVMTTTSESDLVAGLLGLRVPHTLAFIVMLAFRFINVVGGDISIIIQARKSRGLPEKSGLITFVKNMASLLVPLILVTVRRIQMITNAIEVRAFSPGKPRTNYHKLSFGGRDYALFGFAVALIGSTLALRLILGFFQLIPGRL
jgi:energy-coupling factor transport system permease protein